MKVIENKRYIDFKVYDVTKIKSKYGFRIKLIFNDNTTKIQQKSGFKTIRSAKEERDKIIGELYKGVYSYQVNIKFKDFLISWLEDEMKLKVTDNTYNTYKNIVYNHIIPKIGNIYMDVLNQGHIQKFYNSEAEYSYFILRLLNTVLKCSLDFAVDKQIIACNPVLGAKLPKSENKGRFKTLNIDVKKTLTMEQLKLLIEKSKGTSIYLQVLFSGLMGLRRGEVNGLKFSDIDFVNKKLKVQRQLGIVPNKNKEDFEIKTYTKQEIPLKTKSSYRELDIPDIVFEAIVEQKHKYEKNKSRRINDKTNPFQDLGYICCSTYGRPRSKNYCFPYFKKILKDNNLPDIRWHDLRATYATLLIKNNFNLKAISKKMGHAKQIITADVYIDKKELARDCIEELNPFLEEVLPKEDDIYLIDTTNEGIEYDKNLNELIINMQKDFKKENKSNFKECIIDTETEENLDEIIKTMLLA